MVHKTSNSLHIQNGALVMRRTQDVVLPYHRSEFTNVYDAEAGSSLMKKHGLVAVCHFVPIKMRQDDDRRIAFLRRAMVKKEITIQ